MKNPSLQKSTLVSFLLHSILLIISIIFFKQSREISLYQPITVNLISNEILTEQGKTEEIELSHTSDDKAKNTSEIKESAKKDFLKEKELIEKKISTIAAKKKIEKIVRLRSIAISSKENINKKTGLQSTDQNISGNVFDDYYSKITKEIWKQWVYPDIGKKNIEAIISIKILKNGTLIIQNIEKSSGNSLFDKSALKALAKANPLPPPPYEMEIGVRFYP